MASTSTAYEVNIPVQQGGSEERTTSSTTTKIHQEGTGEPNRQKFDDEIRRMEEDMERVRREAQLNSPTDGNDVKVTTIESNGPGGAKHHETRTTKMHSYHKTTKTETQTKKGGNTFIEQPGGGFEGSTISIPRSTVTVREASPHQEVYRATVTPGTTITIKASSRDSTPIKKVVIINESTGQQQEIDLDHQQQRPHSSNTTYYYPSSPQPQQPDFRTSTPIHMEVPQQPPAASTERHEESSVKREMTTNNIGDPNNSGTFPGARKEEEILKEERKKTTSYSSTSTTSTSNKNTTSSGDIHVPFTKLGLGGFDEDLEAQKRAVGQPLGSQGGAGVGFDWDSWASKQQQDFRCVETDPTTGEKRLKLKYELSPREYDAHDFTIKVTKENKIVIKAEHKETNGGKSVWRECSKEYLLPKGVDLEAISSGYNPETGVLSISVPLPKNI